MVLIAFFYPNILI